MKRNFFFSALLTLSLLCPSSQTLAQTDHTTQTTIWLKTDNKDSDRLSAILYGYMPKTPNGKAVIICPGGGYQSLSMDYEGTDFAKWFNQFGVTAFVLKYRMPAGRSNVPLADAERAITIVREHAIEWRIDPEAIGIMGSSAGGHLASTLATQYTSALTRPDFQILLYPVITMDAAYTHAGSRSSLLGSSPSAELVRQFSSEKNVTASVPKAFIAVSAADKLVPVYNSLQYAQALINAQVPVSLHVWPDGYHGFGHQTRFEDYVIFHQELKNWMEEEVTAIVPDSTTVHRTDGLLRSASQLSDNCQWQYSAMDMSVKNLLDGSKATHFHSNATNTTPLSQLNQYIQMDLLEPQEAVQIYFAGRNLQPIGVVTNPSLSMINTPNHIIIAASNTPTDEASWQQVAELTSGFPGVVAGGEYLSPCIELKTPSRYLRMIVKGAEQSAYYWNISELQVFPSEENGTSASAPQAAGTAEDIYTLSGQKWPEQNATKQLPTGVYIVGGRKVLHR